MKLTLRLGIFALVVFAISGATVSAQEKRITEKNVPVAVIKMFKSTYPAATIKGFALQKEGGKTFYEVESKDGDISRDILYNPDGSVEEIEETVGPTELPMAVLDTIRLKYANAVVTKAEKTTRAGMVSYEVIAKKGKKRFALEFDGDGNLRNKPK